MCPWSSQPTVMLKITATATAFTIKKNIAMRVFVVYSFKELLRKLFGVCAGEHITCSLW
jgi:hypothetical protein